MDAFVDVHGGRLGDQQTAGPEKSGHPVEQGARVAADAHVAVHEEHRAPAGLAGERLEDGAAQGLAAETEGVGDGGFTDVDAECCAGLCGEFGDEAAGAAADVQDGALALVQDIAVHLVGSGAPAFHFQGEEPAVCAAEEEGALAGAEGFCVGVGRGPGEGGGWAGHRSAAGRWGLGAPRGGAAD
jgi:hypothetical protein